jgi:hypothetical protein
MPGPADRTAYYLNSKLPRLALIAKGVPFPEGQWIWVADELVAPWQAEELIRDLFPALRGTPMPFIALLTEFDVAEFERDLLAGEA